MKAADQPDAQELQKGQLWKVRHCYVQIVALGNMSVDFKLLDSPSQTGERTLTSDAETLSRYLVSRRGRLVGTAAHRLVCLEYAPTEGRCWQP